MPNPTQAPLFRPVRRRAPERGAAVFVVVLVVTLLSALGLFAVRSATLTNLASGYNRQATQTHYMGEYALLLMAAELGGPARQNYAEEMWSGTHSDKCQASASLTNPTCFPVYYLDIETRVQSYEPTNELLIPTTADGVTPGSLGPGHLEGDFRVELTDIHEGGAAKGMALTGAHTLPRFFWITVTATGQVRPESADPNQADIVSRGAAGIESSRARMLVGPLAH
jgi:hypothetical protein